MRGLALVTQLWHVGFVVALLLGGIAVGTLRRDGRLTAAAGTALVIFVVTYGASWFQWGNSLLLNDPRHFVTRSQLRWIESQLKGHIKEHGELPA